MGSIFGKIFKVVTFGESHGAAVGCVIDGCPAGLSFDTEMAARELARRRPGAGAASTTRRESDTPEILSGVFEGKTLGTPVAIIIRNSDQKSKDYDALKDIYRPGHADFGWDAKYGFRDYRGGGRSSGRETAGRVAAGALAKALLKEYGICVRAWSAEIAGIKAPPYGDPDFDLVQAEENGLFIPCCKTAKLVREKIEALRIEGDSAGGVVACRVSGLPAGLGEPVFDKLDALLAQAVMSIGAVKGIEIGSGFAVKDRLGSENNDIPPPLNAKSAGNTATSDEKLFTSGEKSATSDINRLKNNSGGILGGISTGMALEFRAAIKPVPSISKPQKTFDAGGKECNIEIAGRHDICICPRAVPVIEAMTALVLADLLLQNRSARLNA